MCEETDVEGAQLEPLQHPLACVHPMGSRCDSFHKVVVNKGVHSMLFAHSWVRQRIQSSHQSGEIKPCCSCASPLPRFGVFGVLLLLLTQSGAVEMPPGICNIPVLQNISSILEFWGEIRRDNPRVSQQ